jgi:hypothetical protein
MFVTQRSICCMPDLPRLGKAVFILCGTRADTTMLPVAVAFAVESISRTILLTSAHAVSRVKATQNAPDLSGAAAVATHAPLFICDSVNGQTGEFVNSVRVEIIGVFWSGDVAVLKTARPLPSTTFPSSRSVP